MKTSLASTIDAVRTAIGDCDLSVSEADLYKKLLTEAEGWRMRLEELEDV